MIRIFYSIIQKDADSPQSMVRLLHDTAWALLTRAVGGSLPEILRGESGKPFFADSSLPAFSLSHAGRIAVCAVSDTPLPGTGIGVDVQDIRPRTDDLAIMQRFFHPHEQGRLLAITDPVLRRRMFFLTFSCKEAYSKMTGKGLLEDFRGFEADPEACVIRSADSSAAGYLTLPWEGSCSDPPGITGTCVLALCTPFPLDPSECPVPVFWDSGELSLQVPTL